MSTVVLGVNCAYHESSACLLKEGRIIAAAEEERFTRLKHAKPARVDNGDQLPVHAIDFVLRAGGTRPDEVEHVGLSLDPARRFEANSAMLDPGVPEGDFGTLAGETSFAESVRRAGALLQARFASARLHFLPHHLCHAASTFFPSRHERAAVMAVDGIGESCSTWLGLGEGNRLTTLVELPWPSSLGFLWEKFSQLLGFDAAGGPGKVMGLGGLTGPVGAKSGVDYAARLREVVRLTRDGFTIDNRVTRFRAPDFDGLAPLFGPRRALPPGPLESSEEASVAAALQEVTTEVLLHLARLLHARTDAHALCLAGGVALNCVANAELLARGPFTSLHVQAAAHDAGTALGAACLIWCQLLGQPRPRLDHSFLGPGFGDAELSAAVEVSGFRAQRPDDLARVCARLISEGRPIAWFQDRLEFGPRALGHRSILADPRDPAMREVLNAKVKRREPFRPFAPSALAQDAAEHLELPRDLDAAHVMLLATPVRPASVSRLPAVLQVNAASGRATARVHVVDETIDPLYARLLHELKAQTGLGVVLNTSFNIGEPLVCTPTDALRTFARSGLDALALGPFLVTR